MPDYRSDAPAVELFTADEDLVLATWFEIDRPFSERQVDDILDQWNIPEEIPEYRRIDAAVAQILLERIQDHLPNWTAVVGDRFVVARPIIERRARRKVELWPQHLLTINWAEQRTRLLPAGRAIRRPDVPGFDHTVVTASADCPEAFGGACDLAIGAFGWETSTLDGSRRVIMSDWQRQRREHGQECWAYLFDTGIVDKAEAEAWADVVWSDSTSDYLSKRLPCSASASRAESFTVWTARWKTI